MVVRPILIVPDLIVGIDADINFLIGREVGRIHPIVIGTVLAADKKQRLSVKRRQQNVGIIYGIINVSEINLPGLDPLIEIAGMIGVDGQTDVAVCFQMAYVQWFKGEGIDAVYCAYGEAAPPVCALICSTILRRMSRG